MIKSNFLQKTFSRFFSCAKLYRIDLSDYQEENTSANFECFCFFLPKEDDYPLFENLYSGRYKKLSIIKKLLHSANYTCFAYKDINTGNIVYTSWLCTKSFYCRDMKMQFNFKDNEGIIVDDYTHPAYRNRGLHRKMSKYKLYWIKNNTEIQFLNIVFLCFLPHLSKTQESLGFKFIRRRVSYKKGSFAAVFRGLM